MSPPRKTKTSRAKTSKKTARRGLSFEEILATAPNRRRPYRACPGPATRDIQQLACVDPDPSIEFEVEFVGGGTMTLVILPGEKEPFWMPYFDTDPPGCGYLSDMLEWVRDGIAGREVKTVHAKLRRPRGGQAATEAAAARFAEAVAELAGT